MFWERYNFLCNKINKSPNRVADDAKLFSSTMVTKYKKGAIPNGEILLKVAEYFDVSVDYLLGRDKTPSSGLTENEQTIVRVFKELTDTQQGEIIGRAKMMAEQNAEEFMREESAS